MMVNLSKKKNVARNAVLLHDIHSTAMSTIFLCTRVSTKPPVYMQIHYNTTSQIHHVIINYKSVRIISYIPCLRVAPTEVA